MSKFLVAFNLKSYISLGGSVITYLLTDVKAAFTVLLVVTVIDTATGFYKAWCKNTINSTRFRDKVKHYLAYCLVIISMNQVVIIAPYLEFLVDFVVLFFAAGELISIMENLEESGINMPTYVKKKLLAISKRKK